MAGLFDDLVPAQGATAPAASPHPMFDDLVPAAPLGMPNVPTAASDPIYHGAVPVAQAPDQGATTAFASGVGGVPVIGPAIEGGLQRGAAAIRAYRDGTSYGDELARVQEMTDIARQQHPTAAFTGDLTSAALALAPATAAAPAAFGAEGGALTSSQIARGVVAGTGLGGADGAVRGGANGIIPGAIGGALGGGAAPVLGSAASRIGTGIADNAARMLALRNVGISAPAADIITRAAEADGALGGQGAANIAAAGPHGMLADAGPGVATVLDTAMQRGGPGTVAARQAIEARAAGANTDINGALDRAFGAPQGVQTATDAIRDSTAAARQTAYDTAYNTPIDYTGDQGRALEDMIANRVPPGIIARANMQMRIDGTPSRQMIQRPDGSLEQMPDVRQIDYITRSLNDVSRAGDGQGALGGNTAEGRSYGNLSRDLRSTLRNVVPEYGTALDTAAQPIEARNALDFGATMLRPSVARDEAAATIQGMTPPEVAQARQGVRSQMAETLANVQRTITDPNTDAREAMAAVKQMSSDAAQQKVAMLLDPPEHQALFGALDQATRALELRGQVATNSRTFARTATNEMVQDAAQPGILSRAIMSGGPMKATRPFAEVLTGNTPADIAQRQDAVYGELANVLTGPRGQAATDLLSRLGQANNTRAAANSIAGAIPYSQLAQTGVLALLTSMNHPTTP